MDKQDYRILLESIVTEYSLTDVETARLGREIWRYLFDKSPEPDPDMAFDEMVGDFCFKDGHVVGFM